MSTNHAFISQLYTCEGHLTNDLTGDWYSLVSQASQSGDVWGTVGGYQEVDVLKLFSQL